MTRTYTIVRQINVPAPVEQCWRYLTEPDLVGDWFAGVVGSIADNSGFEFHFGDGDFFRGAVESADAPLNLRFWWRFMGAGSRSDIEYALLPLADQSTLVTVIDRGEHSAAGALEMCEGWDDFLMRLERRVRTGVNSRYRWTESIGCGAILPAPADEARVLLSRPETWDAFPQTLVSIEDTDKQLVVTMGDAAWHGQTTAASLSFCQSGAGTRVSVAHRGFDRLSQPIQFDERKRYAGYWAAFLAGLEAPETTAKEAGAVG